MRSNCLDNCVASRVPLSCRCNMSSWCLNLTLSLEQCAHVLFSQTRALVHQQPEAMPVSLSQPLYTLAQALPLGNLFCAAPEGLHVLARRVRAEAGVKVRRLEGVAAAQRHAAPRLGPHHQQLRTKKHFAG